MWIKKIKTKIPLNLHIPINISQVCQELCPWLLLIILRNITSFYSESETNIKPNFKLFERTAWILINLLWKSISVSTFLIKCIQVPTSYRIPKLKSTMSSLNNGTAGDIYLSVSGVNILALMCHCVGRYFEARLRYL